MKDKKKSYGGRKRTVLRFFHYCTIGYFTTLIITILLKTIGYSSISYNQILLFGIIAIGSSLFLTLLIYIRKNLTRSYTFSIAIAQFASWIMLFALWIFLLKEARIIALFFALMPLTFMLTTTNYVQSLIISIGATLIMLGVSYAGIYHFNQQGDFFLVMIYTGSFFLVALYMSYLAGQFYNQRFELRKAKKLAEETSNELWGEMELAKKIQTVLLPEEPAIKGFEISANMSPADQVGGDYYDIINVGGHDWVVIGDVSGHGVSAGLIMMMVQISIRATIASNPNVSPPDLLTSINGVLAENIKKLGESKYMTITVLAVHDEGKFHLSGLHQDIMIYRAKDKRVELFETRGMWIGIVDDISSMMESDDLLLEANDVMLLYTDGVTEALDCDKVMFSSEKLAELFQSHGDESPDGIKNAILNELQPYECPDDVTIVVLKRNEMQYA